MQLIYSDASSTSHHGCPARRDVRSTPFFAGPLVPSDTNTGKFTHRLIGVFSLLQYGHTLDTYAYGSSVLAPSLYAPVRMKKSREIVKHC